MKNKETLIDPELKLGVAETPPVEVVGKVGDFDVIETDTELLGTLVPDPYEKLVFPSNISPYYHGLSSRNIIHQGINSDKVPFEIFSGIDRRVTEKGLKFEPVVVICTEGNAFQLNIDELTKIAVSMARKIKSEPSTPLKEAM